MTKKSRRPVRSVGSAKTIAIAIAIDDGKIIVKAIGKLLNIEFILEVCVDSKYLWDSLSSCHEPTDKAVKADVNVTRYEFHTRT